MAANNLRIIYKNRIDDTTTTITSSVVALGTTNVNNLKKDAKSLVLRTTGQENTLTVNFGGTVTIRGVVLPFTNLTSTATIKVTTIGGETALASVEVTGAFDNKIPGTYSISAALISAPQMAGGVKPTMTLTYLTPSTAIVTVVTAGSGYTSPMTISGDGLQALGGTGAGTIVLTAIMSAAYTTGDKLACEYQQADNWDSSYLPTGANGFSYGSGTYARIWFPIAKPCTGLSILISDMGNTAEYLEISRLVAGDYWSPTFNTSFGLSNSPKDLSSNTRTESGDLVTTRGVRYNTMRFDLTWLSPDDRLIMTKILKANGLSKPMLISLFPDCEEDYDKEQTYQIFGKLSQLSDISHPMFGIYSSSIDIEEV